MSGAKIGPREAALRAQREAESEALERWADDKRRAAKRAKKKRKAKR